MSNVLDPIAILGAREGGNTLYRTMHLSAGHATLHVSRARDILCDYLVKLRFGFLFTLTELCFPKSGRSERRRAESTSSQSVTS